MLKFPYSSILLFFFCGIIQLKYFQRFLRHIFAAFIIAYSIAYFSHFSRLYYFTTWTRIWMFSNWKSDCELTARWRHPFRIISSGLYTNVLNTKPISASSRWPFSAKYYLNISWSSSWINCLIAQCAMCILLCLLWLLTGTYLFCGSSLLRAEIGVDSRAHHTPPYRDWPTDDDGGGGVLVQWCIIMPHWCWRARILLIFHFI